MDRINNYINMEKFRILKDDFGNDVEVSKATGIERSLVNKHYNNKRNISLGDLIRYARCL